MLTQGQKPVSKVDKLKAIGMQIFSLVEQENRAISLMLKPFVQQGLDSIDEENAEKIITFVKQVVEEVERDG
jgi:hypothetical protein